MILLEELPHLSLWHDPLHACLYANWHGAHGRPATQTGYEFILQHCRATGSTKLVNDGSLDQDGWLELADWLANVYFKQVAQEGVLTVAWVLPADTNARCDAMQVIVKATHPLMDIFTDAEAAYEWLHRWPTPSFALKADGTYK